MVSNLIPEKIRTLYSLTSQPYPKRRPGRKNCLPTQKIKALRPRTSSENHGWARNGMDKTCSLFCYLRTNNGPPDLILGNDQAGKNMGEKQLCYLTFYTQFQSSWDFCSSVWHLTWDATRTTENQREANVTWTAQRRQCQEKWHHGDWTAKDANSSKSQMRVLPQQASKHGVFF